MMMTADWLIAVKLMMRVWLCPINLKGIQAQTVANFYLAFEAHLTIIPIVNKVCVSLLYVHLLYV